MNKPAALFIIFLIFFFSPSAIPQTNGSDYQDSPFGFLPAIVTPPFEYGITNPYGYAVDLGVRWDRSLHFIWMLIQPDPEKEEYRWADERQLRDVPPGIHLLANMSIGSPDQFVAPPEHAYRYYEYAQRDSFLPKDEQAYVRFVKAVVERYDGDGINDMPGLRAPIKYWQVDNEPPHGLSDYALFLKITYQAIKEADPEAKVLIGGVPGMPPVSAYLKIFDKDYLPILTDLSKMQGRYFDIFDFHWYGDASGDYRYIRDVFRYIKQKVDERGLSPWDGYWITEMGTYSGDPAPIPMLVDYDYPFQTERQQAADLLKRYACSLSLGIKKIFMGFGIVEGFKRDESYFDFTGLIYDGRYKDDQGKGVKKLAYYTYKKMTEILEGSDWNNIEIIQDKEGIFVFKFIKQGKPVWVAWNDDPRERQIVIAGIAARQVKITEAVPKFASGKDVADYRSAFLSETKTVSGGKAPVILKESPVFVEEI